MKGIFLIRAVLLILGFAWMSGCARKPPVGGPFLRTAVNGDLSRVDIEARGARLSEILGELRTKHGIDVRPNSDADPRIRVNILAVPLEDALDRLMPAGVRYAVRTGDREGVGRQGGAVKKKGLASYQEQTGRPAKDKQPAAQLGPIRKLGFDVEVIRPLPSVNVKSVAALLAQVPPGRGSKVPAPSAGPISGAVRSVRLSLTMRTGGQVQVNSAAILDGAIQDNRVRGAYLFALRRSNGGIIQVGSFADPLEQHSYRKEDGTHDATQAPEGLFGITLNESLTRDRPEALSIEIYDARGVALPLVLDEKTFQTATRRAKRVTQLRGNELVRVLREAK